MTPGGIARLKLDEGFRGFPYDDATGQPVSAGGNVTVLYGCNLSSSPFTEAEGDLILQYRLQQNRDVLVGPLFWLPTVPPVWQDVVEMVQFNTGKVLQFVHMLAAMQAGDGPTAADELLDSRAARELPARYGRMAGAIRNRSWIATSA